MSACRFEIKANLLKYTAELSSPLGTLWGAGEKVPDRPQDHLPGFSLGKCQEALAMPKCSFSLHLYTSNVKRTFRTTPFAGKVCLIYQGYSSFFGENYLIQDVQMS